VYASSLQKVLLIQVLQIFIPKSKDIKLLNPVQDDELADVMSAADLDKNGENPLAPPPLPHPTPFQPD